MSPRRCNPLAASRVAVPLSRVLWIRDDRLLIPHRPLARVFRSEARMGSVAVGYEAR